MQQPNSSFSRDNVVYAGVVGVHKIHALLMAHRYLYLAGTEILLLHEKKVALQASKSILC